MELSTVDFAELLQLRADVDAEIRRRESEEKAKAAMADGELSAEDMPVVLSDNTLSMALTCPRYALASLLSAVLF